MSENSPQFIRENSGYRESQSFFHFVSRAKCNLACSELSIAFTCGPKLYQNACKRPQNICEDPMQLLLTRSHEKYGINPTKNIDTIRKNKAIFSQELLDLWTWTKKCHDAAIEDYGKASFEGKTNYELKVLNIHLNLFDYIRVMIMDPGEDSCLLNPKAKFEEEKMRNPIEKKVIFDRKINESPSIMNLLKYLGWTGINYTEKPQNEQFEVELRHICESHEKNNEFSWAAAIAIFHFNFKRALVSLRKGIAHFEGSEESKTLLNEFKFVTNIIEGLKNVKADFTEPIQVASNHSVKSTAQKKNMNYVQAVFGSPFDEQPESASNYANNHWKESSRKGSKSGTPKLTSDHEQDIQEFEKNKLEKKCLQNLIGSLELQDPYLNSISKFIANKSQEEALFFLKNVSQQFSFYDRLAFAVRFLDKEELWDFIQKYVSDSQKNGRLEALILTGEAQITANILQKYLDQTSDVQTIALLCMAFNLLRTPLNRKLGEACYESLETVLNLFNKFDERNELLVGISTIEKTFQDAAPRDKKRNQPAQKLEVKPTTFSTSISLRCFYCNNGLSKEMLAQPSFIPKKGMMKTESRTIDSGTSCRVCPICMKSLPICAICLLPISVTAANPSSGSKFLSKSLATAKPTKPSEAIPMQEAITWCQNCRHGGHLKHVLEWFMTRSVCPMANCSCECKNI